MAFDEGLAQRVREALDARGDFQEKRMFGGVAFLIAGNMCCGVNRDDLVVRLDPDEANALLESEQGARPMDLTGRPLLGWLFVSPKATADDEALEQWVRRAQLFAASLPAK